MSRTKGITQDRARASLILAEIDKLVAELDGLPRDDLGQVLPDAVDTLMTALGDAREMVGDVLDMTVLGRDVWHIAARPPMTRKQLDEELEARGVRRAS
jgi:hypothetical protein